MAVSRDGIVAAIEEYCRAESAKDKAAWLSLFTDDVIHEDPVGVAKRVGLEAVGAFWDSFQVADIELWLEEPIIVCGNEAVALMRASAGPADNRRTTGRIVDHFTFNDDGKITQLRAFLEMA